MDVETYRLVCDEKNVWDERVKAEMKYGYMFYQRPILKHATSSCVNLGDPIQSLAVEHLYREMGISEKDIIPIPRFDIENYSGEECICVTNGHYGFCDAVFNIEFVPSPKIHMVPMSMHVNRRLSERELECFRHAGGVGTRDYYTAQYLKSLGIDAYLTGCLTMTFPKRTAEQSKKASEIYIMVHTCYDELAPFVPRKIKEKAVYMENFIRYDEPLDANHFLSYETTLHYHSAAAERLALLCNTARLVITDRLHVAVPCVAMGIPVVLAKNNLGERFGFIDRIIPCYNKNHFSEIDWDPKPCEIEEEREIMRRHFAARVKGNKEQTASTRFELENMWNRLKPIIEIPYITHTDLSVEMFPADFSGCKYAIWGCFTEAAMFLKESLDKKFPKSELICYIDKNYTGKIFGVNISTPEEIDKLPLDTVILIPAKSAFDSAKKFLLPAGRRFIFVKNADIEVFNF